MNKSYSTLATLVNNSRISLSDSNNSNSTLQQPQPQPSRSRQTQPEKEQVSIVNQLPYAHLFLQMWTCIETYTIITTALTTTLSLLASVTRDTQQSNQPQQLSITPALIACG